MIVKPRSLAHFRTYGIAYVVLASSLACTFAAFFAHRNYVHERDHARFMQASEAAFNQIEAQLQVFLTLMKGVRALLSGNPHITPGEIARYFQVLKVQDLQRETGLEGIGVLLAVSPDNREQHVRLMRQSIPEYRLRSRTVERTAFPIIYLEALGRGMEEAPLGWDVAQNPVRASALEAAARTGQPTATAKTHLLYSGQTNPAPGFLIYLPVFSQAMAAESPPTNLFGVVFTSFDSQKLWSNLFSYQHQSIDLEVYDGEILEPGHLLFDRDGQHHATLERSPRFQGSISADFFGRRWTFLFSGPDNRPLVERILPLLIAALGTMSSFLLFGFVFFQAASRATAETLTRGLRDSEQFVRRVNEQLARKVEEAEAAHHRASAEKERLAVTLGAISDAVVATDPDGRILLMNPVAEQLGETSATKAAGQEIGAVFKLHDPQTRAPLSDPYNSLADPGESGARQHALFLAPSGKEMLIQRRVAPIRDASGHALGAVFVFRDVTRERKAEEELLRASKLESLGLLAGGIAHDFNNVLTGIVGNLSLLRETPGLPPEVSQRLELLEKTAYKARLLTLQLLTFAKGGSPIKQAASIREVIVESAEFALRGSNLRAEFQFPEDLAPVEIDAGQISQVVQNLVINGKQAMPEGGVIRISAANCLVTDSGDLPLKPGGYVRVATEDHGGGIQPDHLGKVFDPYFTTKTGGTGLGLATAYSILKRHEGLITVQSEWGRGSTFYFYLPAASTAPAAPPPEDAALPAGAGRILVMDDEPGIRLILCDILRHFGYAPVAVADGREAIRAYERARSSGEPYDAVIMDLTIPGGMGGKDAIQELRKIDPNVRAIVSSGYSNDPVLARHEAYGFVARVEKPYRLPELAAALKRVLPTPGAVARIQAG